MRHNITSQSAQNDAIKISLGMPRLIDISYSHHCLDEQEDDRNRDEQDTAKVNDDS